MKASSTLSLRIRRPTRRRPWALLAVPLLTAAAGLAVAPPAQAAGTVNVSFVEPDRFSDLSLSTLDRERELQEIATHLRQLGQRLPDGQTLNIEVLDVDLAGETWPRAASQVRVLRGRTDWPTIQLRWTLQQGDTTLSSGEDRVADMSYLTGHPPSVMLGALPYEKRMLERWFSNRFEAAEKAPH